MKVAIVYDRVNKFGGAERVLLALHDIWPDAPLYTAVYNPKRAKWADVFRVHPSFLQFVPLAKQHHELFPWLTPMGFESFHFDTFDIVISVTSAEAKDIITKPGTIHICYCLTPTRYLWSGEKEYEKSGFSGRMLKLFAPTLKKWDMVASARPDAYIAISKLVASRVERYYHKKVEKIIYPPVDTAAFAGHSGKKLRKSDSYFLVVSRLVGYKRIDLVIQAFNMLGWPLVVVGDGYEKQRLHRMAKGNIRFIESVSDRELAYYYQHCRAFVFAGQEDFGIAAVEAQAAGVPVIAYKQSGIAEIVIDGKTGVLFKEQTVSSLTDALKEFALQWYDSFSCVENARRFSKVRFQHEMKKTVLTVYNRHI